MNENQEIHLPAVGIIAAFCVLLFILGWFGSPRGDDGRPILLLADVKAVEDYRRLAIRSVEEMRQVDGEIGSVLSASGSDLYAQTRAAQQSLEHALRVVQTIEHTSTPPAMTGLREMLGLDAQAYLEAARQTLLWVSLPNDENLAAIHASLEQAQAGLKELEESQWLRKRSP